VLITAKKVFNARPTIFCVKRMIQPVALSPFSGNPDIWGQCYKNTRVNYNLNPTFSRVKMMQYITAILG
jgi:hypothetical protein